MSHPFILLQRFGLEATGVMQVGASSGQEVEAIAASGVQVAVLIEPLSVPYQKLCERTKKYPSMIAIRALCSNVAGEVVDFKVASNGGMSSSILEPSNHKIIHPDVKFFDKISIKTTTVDHIVNVLREKIGNHTKKINTLMMDVQGAEHLVIEGAKNFLDQIDYIFCEVSLGGLYEGDMAVEALQDFLAQRGFRICWLEINRKGWGDALFIRSKFFEVMRVQAGGSAED